MLQLATDDKVPIGHTFINSQKSLFVLLIKEKSRLVSWESTSGPWAALGTLFCLSHQSPKVQRSHLSCWQLVQQAFPILKGCSLSGCYIRHVSEFTWCKSVICFYAQLLQCYPFFPENIIGMSWKASPNFFFFGKVCISQTSLLLDFLSPPWLILWMAHVKSNNNV